jgi:hypothetical protein
MYAWQPLLATIPTEICNLHITYTKVQLEQQLPVSTPDNDQLQSAWQNWAAKPNDHIQAIKTLIFPPFQ